MLLRVLTALAIGGQLLQSFNRVAAQTSSVICASSYNWADNSKGQDPCIVAAYLLRPCGTTVVDIPVLPANEHYDPGDTSDCNCNTVLYSLVSACADCQIRQYDTWTKWSQNCTNVYPSIYPHPIPIGTAVPAWAYLDVVTGNNYDPGAAINDHAPESSAIVSQSQSQSQSSSSFYFPPASTTSTTSKPKQLNVGAIAGGAVAGLVVISLSVVSIVWLVVRNRNRNRSRVVEPDDFGGLDKVRPMAPQPGPRSPIDDTTYNVYPVAVPGLPPAPTYPMPKLYDPSDPSTFPSMPDAAYAPSVPSVYASAPQYTPSPPPQSTYSTQQTQGSMSYTSTSPIQGPHPQV